MKNNLLRAIPALVGEGGELNIWGDLVSIALTVVLAWIVTQILVWLLQRWGDHVIKHKAADNPGRIRTVIMMATAVIKVVVGFIALTAILEIFGVNAASLVATAGVGALAIGFGAQSLVKDVITGFFILWEDQFAVGDMVETAGFTGTVKELGVRTTKVVGLDGALHIIPNGEITMVTNFNRGPALAMVQVPISYKEDINRATAVLAKAMETVAETDSSFVEGPVVQGVSDFAESSMQLQVFSMVKPGTQLAAERKIRQVAKEALEAEKISIPYSQLEVQVTMNQTEENA